MSLSADRYNTGLGLAPDYEPTASKTCVESWVKIYKVHYWLAKISVVTTVPTYYVVRDRPNRGRSQEAGHSTTLAGFTSCPQLSELGFRAVQRIAGNAWQDFPGQRCPVANFFSFSFQHLRQTCNHRDSATCLLKPLQRNAHALRTCIRMHLEWRRPFSSL